MRTDEQTMTDGRTNRHYEANSRFFAILRTCLKWGVCKNNLCKQRVNTLTEECQLPRPQ